MLLEIVEMIVETKDMDTRTEECEDCMMIVKKKIGEECDVCGEGEEYEIPEMALIGMDAVALFPSLSGKNTARIIRETTEKTTLEMENFDWKKGMIYVKVNKHLTTIRKEMRRFLPVRKS